MIALGHRPVGTEGGHAAGRALLEALYRQHVGGPMPAILTGPRGKPYFAEGAVNFSITHTKHHVFCALSHSPIGIDAEELDRKIDLRLAGRILSPGEKAQYDAAPDPRLALLTFWVLKEATGKQCGFGINANPNQTNFSLHDPRVQIMENCLLAIAENAECQMPNSE